MLLSNEQNQLDLQITITCDQNLVKGYLVTAPIFPPAVNETRGELDFTKIDTTSYSCGNRVRVKQQEAAVIILIQDIGLSVVYYDMGLYTGLSGGQIGGIIGAIVGALVVLGLGIYLYKRH